MNAPAPLVSRTLLALPAACLALLLTATSWAGIASASESQGSAAKETPGIAAVHGRDNAAAADTAAAVQREGDFSYLVAADGAGVTVTGYAGASRSVAIPQTIAGKPVTALAGGAFLDNANLVDVTLPATLKQCVAGTKPDGGAVVGPFAGCSNLTTVAFEKGATAVPENLLTGCTSLKVTLALPDSVASIPQNMGQTQWLTIKAHPGTAAAAFAEQNNHEFVDATIRAQSVALSQSEMRLTREQTGTLTATVAPADCEEPLVWSTSDPSIATVSSGIVTPAGGLGVATITAKAGSKSASCTVTVWQPVTSVELNRATFQMEANTVRQLTASALPENATDKRVTWSSSNPSVATVNAQTGLVTGIAEGSATITATAVDGAGASKSLTVTVVNNAYTVTNAGAVATPHPYANNCSDSWTYRIPGAQALSVTFDERTSVEDTFDGINVFDAGNRRVGQYTGTQLAGETITVPGDTVTVRLDADEMVNDWGFAVVSVTDATPDGYVVRDGATYLYDYGKLVTGVVKLDDGWHYFDQATGAMATGVTQLPDGRVVYFDDKGVLQTGDIYIDGVRYRFDAETGNLLGIGDPAPTPTPDPDPTPEQEWNLVYAENGHVSSSFFSFDIPDAWRDRVQVSLVTDTGTPYAAISLPGQPKQALATLTVRSSEGYEPLGGDAATSLAGWWDNGKGQVVELWVKNPAVMLYNDMIYGSSSFPDEQTAAALIDLASGGMYTIDSVRAATSEQEAAAMNRYAQDELVPNVYVALYDADGNVVGRAENGVKAPVVEEIALPDVTGWNYIDAENALAQSGFACSEVWDANAEATPGTVLSTEPVAGSLFPKGGTVTLHISNGPEMLTLGSYAGWSAGDAQADLANLGMESTVDSSLAAPDAASEGIAYGTDPAEGTSVAKGSHVTVLAYGAYVAPEPEPAPEPAPEQAPAAEPEPEPEPAAEPAPEPAPEPETPAEPTPEATVEPEPAPTPETTVEPEPAPEPAPEPVATLSLDNAQNRISIENLLNTFVWAYPAPWFDANAVDAAQTENLARYAVNALIQADGLASMETFDAASNPLGFGTFTLRVDAERVLAAVRAACGVELDLTQLAGDQLYYDGTYVYCDASSGAFANAYAVSAVALSQVDAAHYMVSLNLYATTPADLEALEAQAKDAGDQTADVLHSGIASLAASLSANGVAAQAGGAVVEVSFAADGTVQQARVVSLGIA